MADNFVLTGVAGTQLNLGTWLDAQKGPDFDPEAVQRAVYAEHPAAEGGMLAYEHSVVRRFRFPLILASQGAFSGLTGLESLVRNLARPGAYVDLQPHGVASADAIRFDVLAGRLREDYRVWHQRVARRLSTLELDVKPFGYLPTTILLASAASVGLPGALTIPNASIIGDAPGLGLIQIQPTAPTGFPAGSWRNDLLAWSFSGRSGATAFWPAASLSGINAVATLIADQFAPGSQGLLLGMAGFGDLMTSYSRLDIGINEESKYRGRHRLFLYARITASWLPVQVSADVAVADLPLASAQPVATITPPVATGNPGVYGAQASPAYQLLDLGEISLPLHASGEAHAQKVRFYFREPSGNASTGVVLGGAYLLPIDGGAGIVPKGVAVPTTFPINNNVRPNLKLNAIAPYIVFTDTDVGAPISEPLFYRGDLPYVGASTLRLDLLGGARKVGVSATNPLVRSAPLFAAVSVSYRPRFTFLK